MGTRKICLNEAVLTCTHNICFEQNMKIVKKEQLLIVTENYRFYSRGKSLYIAWACFRNVIPKCLDNFDPIDHREEISNSSNLTQISQMGYPILIIWMSPL